MAKQPAYNKAVFTLTWPADKWMGQVDWARDIELLQELIVRLGLNLGKARVKIEKTWENFEE